MINTLLVLVGWRADPDVPKHRFGTAKEDYLVVAFSIIFIALLIKVFN